MERVLVVGSVNPELVFRYRSGGTKVRADSYTIQLGGTAYNVAARLSALLNPVDVLFEALVGQDVMGSAVHERIGGIAHEMLWWRPVTAVACILLPEGGLHQTIGFKQAAASSRSRVAQLDRIMTREHPQIVLAAGLIPGEEWIAQTLFTGVRPSKLRVLCPDVLACANGTLDAVLAHTDLLVMNEEEARVFFRADSSELREEVIRARVVCNVIVTRAEHGAVFFERGSSPVEVATERVDVRNPVGAGDTFLAALLAEVARGVSPGVALRAAVAAGTRHVAAVASA
ncbi:MAG: carbohydrate kinase family protein [bacterium]|nr:carbohydrate kinase family protein [bacterium]